MKDKKLLEHLLKEVEALKFIVYNKENPKDEVWLDSADIKQLFNFSDSKLYRLRKNNQIPCTTVGGKYYYPKSYFNAILIERIKYKDKDRFSE